MLIYVKKMQTVYCKKRETRLQCVSHVVCKQSYFCCLSMN